MQMYKNAQRSALIDSFKYFLENDAKMLALGICVIKTSNH